MTVNTIPSALQASPWNASVEDSRRASSEGNDKNDDDKKPEELGETLYISGARLGVVLVALMLSISIVSMDLLVQH